MHSRGAVDEINACIINLENNQCDQSEEDNVYESMCETVNIEMRDKLDSKTITLHSSNKRTRILGGLISFQNCGIMYSVQRVGRIGQMIE